MGEEGPLQLVINKCVFQPDPVGAMSEIFDTSQCVKTYETVILVVDSIGFKGGPVPFPHGKGLELPPVVQVMKYVFYV